MDNPKDEERRIPETGELIVEEQEVDMKVLEWIFEQYDATFRSLARR